MRKLRFSSPSVVLVRGCIAGSVGLLVPLLAARSHPVFPRLFLQNFFRKKLELLNKRYDERAVPRASLIAMKPMVDRANHLLREMGDMPNRISWREARQLWLAAAHVFDMALCADVALKWEGKGSPAFVNAAINLFGLISPMSNDAREAIVGDLHENAEEWREGGWSEPRIMLVFAVRFVIASVNYLLTKGSFLLSFAGWLLGR